MHVGRFGSSHRHEGRWREWASSLSMLLSLAYVVIGLIVANSHHYFVHLSRIQTDRFCGPGRPALAPPALRDRPPHQIGITRARCAGRGT